MTTREKVLVGLMCLAIIIGAWEIIGNKESSGKPPAHDENPVEQARAFISEFSQKFVSGKIPDGYNYMIGLAGDNWPKDPFLMQSGALTSQKEPQKTSEPENPVEPRPTFVYSGFLQVGDSKLAIINGLEYTQGDSLIGHDYYVKSISPQIVILAKTKGSEIKEIELPIQE